MAKSIVTATNRFIVIEGVDGVGKTTVSRLLAETVSAVYFQTPSGFWKNHRGIAEKAGPCFRCIFYGLATLWASLIITSILKRHSVVCDRYIYSTWAYHQVSASCVSNLILKLSGILKKPDVVFYLHVSPDVRNARIGLRKDNTVSDYDESLQNEVHLNYLSFKQMVLVETTDLKPKEVVALMMNNVEKTE
ncbi:MAG: deoxynucleoside kinase [Desulfamplus sp.]|nr:deoxynucleoside kinase [Desulfamplus sp.]